MSECKVSTFFTLLVIEMIPFQPLHLITVCVLWLLSLLHCTTNKLMCIATMDGGRGTERGEIAKNQQWPTIGLHFIRYKKKTNTFIWCAVCGEIVPHTGDPQQIITYLCIYLHQWDLIRQTCSYCTDEDDIQHFLLTCDKETNLGSIVFKWWANISDLDISNFDHLEECVLYGFTSEKKILMVTNCCILVAAKTKATKRKKHICIDEGNPRMFEQFEFILDNM